MDTTPWPAIRELMSAVIDACEASERLGLSENDRGRTTPVGATQVSVFDLMVSSWTYPENARHAIIRARHDLGRDERYVSDRARALVRVAELCAELVGIGDQFGTPTKVLGSAGEGDQSAEQMVGRLRDWYLRHLVPRLADAASSRPSVE